MMRILEENVGVSPLFTSINDSVSVQTVADRHNLPAYQQRPSRAMEYLSAIKKPGILGLPVMKYRV